MIVLISPEPGVRRCHVEDELSLSVNLLLAPWQLPIWAPAWGAAARFVEQRRQRERARRLLGYPMLEVVSRLWARGQTHRLLEARFVLRRGLSFWAARVLRSLGAGDTIIAPALTARRAFAAAPNAQKILWQDLPCLRQLHRDLDAQAERYPSSAYLRRFRAPDWAVIDQEVEWELADVITVRGHFAHRTLQQGGISSAKLKPIFQAKSYSAPTRRPSGGVVHVALAEIACARHFTNEVHEVLTTRPWLRVHLRSGEGSEPRELLSHPQVQELNEDSWPQLDALLAVSCCESYARAIDRARNLGLPVIATQTACAWHEVASIPQSDAAQHLGAAIDRLLSQGRVPA